MRPPSLKAILPDIGRILAISPHVLYVRQQALMRDAILESQPGRGPGSGVVASPETVATLLVAILSSVSLADTPERAAAFCAAMPAKGSCPLTGAHNLKDAIAKVLSDPTIAERINGLLFGSTIGQAFIRYDGVPFELGPEAFAAGEFKSSIFIASDIPKSPLRVSIDIDGDTVREIAALVAKLDR
jgi:hypothetical protein